MLTSAMEKVYRSRGLSRALRAVSHITALLSAAAYVYLLIDAYLIMPIYLLLPLFISGVPFVTVSAIRHFINAPRPYELLDFYEEKPKTKSAHSFPSRHTFSVFSIATLLLFASPPLGALLLLFGIALAVSRVLLGIHFLRDVIAGAIIGITSSLIGVYIVSVFI